MKGDGQRRKLGQTVGSTVMDERVSGRAARVNASIGLVQGSSPTEVTKRGLRSGKLGQAGWKNGDGQSGQISQTGWIDRDGRTGEQQDIAGVERTLCEGVAPHKS